MQSEIKTFVLQKVPKSMVTNGRLDEFRSETCYILQWILLISRFMVIIQQGEYRKWLVILIYIDY